MTFTGERKEPRVGEMWAWQGYRVEVVSGLVDLHGKEGGRLQARFAGAVDTWYWHKGEGWTFVSEAPQAEAPNYITGVSVSAPVAIGGVMPSGKTAALRAAAEAFAKANPGEVIAEATIDGIKYTCVMPATCKRCGYLGEHDEGTCMMRWFGKPGATEEPASMAEPEPVRKAHRFAVGQWVRARDTTTPIACTASLVGIHSSVPMQVMDASDAGVVHVAFGSGLREVRATLHAADLVHRGRPQ